MHGSPDATRSNVVLATVSLSGSHHRLDFLIGPGRALDPARWCVLCVDPIGNGMTTSPSNSQRQPGAAFPRFVLRDMVESQRYLLDSLRIDRLAAVVGASMGGMQALQWGVSHPDRVGVIVAMTPMAKTAPWAVAIVEAARLAPPLDLFDPAHEADAIAAAIPGSRRVVIPSVQGYQAAGTASPDDGVFLNAEIGAFLGATA